MHPLPVGSWDCHTHVLDPSKFPYRYDRAYTPSEASLSSLFDKVTTDCIVIVQASPENGEDAVVAHLQKARKLYPWKTVRAAVLADDRPKRNVTMYSDDRIKHLHNLGVRCIRLQSNYNSFSPDLQNLREYLISAVVSYPVIQFRWSIALQMPLKTWAGLFDLICLDDRFAAVSIIAEHNACATPEDVSSQYFQVFLDMLRSGRVHVKISALHRRAPQNISSMREVVTAFANAAPQSILWGSDWPHVNASIRGLQPTPHLKMISWKEELELVRTWLSEEDYLGMLVRNPSRLLA